MRKDTVLDLRSVTRSFHQAGKSLEILRAVNLSIAPGEIVALVGASGSGKSTLLQIAGLLDTPTSGAVAVAGVDASSASEMKRTQLRLHHLGFVYQFHHLLPEFSACENVMIPQQLAGVSAPNAKARAASLLSALGLAERMQHRPAALSGGEQQRVAIARALANQPALILADEPTGNLDPVTSESVFAMFMSLAKSQGLSALVATHNHELARKMDRIVTISQGTLC